MSLRTVCARELTLFTILAGPPVTLEAQPDLGLAYAYIIGYGFSAVQHRFMSLLILLGQGALDKEQALAGVFQLIWLTPHIECIES